MVGLLLFRAVLEDWPGPFIVNSLALCHALARRSFKKDDGAAPWFSPVSCPPGSATGCCLQDHLYGQWLESQFETRRAQARERVQGRPDTLCGRSEPRVGESSGRSACSPALGSSCAPGTPRKARRIFTLKM